MIEKEVLEHAFRDAIMLFPVLLYLGICFAVASDLVGICDWFSTLFDFSGSETIGDYLLGFVLLLLGLSLTPGALIYFILRSILRINIRHSGKDNENENCNSGC